MKTEPCASSTALETIFSEAISSICFCSRFSSCRDAGEHGGIGIGEAAGEEAVGLHVVQRFAGWCSCGLPFEDGVGELVDAARWRSPPNVGGEEGGEARLGHFRPDQPRAHRDHVGSLCSRASAAESGSETSAQRQAGWRLTAIEMPMPEPHSATPLRRAAVGDRLGERGSHNRDNRPSGAVRPEIEHLVPGLARQCGERGLELDRGVIGGDGDGLGHGQVPVSRMAAL